MLKFNMQVEHVHCTMYVLNTHINLTQKATPLVEYNKRQAAKYYVM